MIRRAKAADVPVIHRLIVNASLHDKILKRTPHDIRNNVRHFWVAEEEGRVQACCSLEVYSKKLAEIRSLTVNTSGRKRGIATALIELCLREAKRRSIYEVLAITDRENLFKRQGFSEQLHGQKALFLRL